MNYLWVALGGAVGSVLRYGIGQFIFWIAPQSSLPWGTFLANVFGALCIGGIIAFDEHAPFLTDEMRLLVITGVLGGFTTFSTFSLETIKLIREDMMGMAILNIALTLILSLTLIYFLLHFKRFFVN